MVYITDVPCVLQGMNHGISKTYTIETVNTDFTLYLSICAKEYCLF